MMWNLITGKSSEKPEAPPSESRRRKDYDQRSTQQPSESIVSSKSARKPSRGDDRDGDRGFNPTSTSYSSTSRGSYPGTASASTGSSYATASNGQTDDAALPPGLVRTASLADQPPKPRASRDDRVQGRARERKGERRRSSSRDRKRDKDSKRRERKTERDKVDRANGMDRGLTRSGSGYAEELSTTRAGDFSAQASGSFNAQVGSSGFTQFPGQYDAGMPGFTNGPPPLHVSMSAHVQDQFPGQFPLESAAPYRPPLAASEGGPGLAAEYYGDAGESVAEQPGVRPQPIGPIIGAEPHLQPASHIAAPPPEPSSVGGVGAAASFYSGVDFPSTLPSQPSMSNKPPRHGKPSKPTSSGSFSGSAVLAGSAVLGYTAGTAGEASYTQGSASNDSAYYQQGSGRPTSSATGTAGYPSTSAPVNNGYHTSSAPVLPTLGAAAAGAAAGYMMGSHSSAHQQPSVISGHGGYSSSATQRPLQFGEPAIGVSANPRPPRPAKYSSQSSTLSLHAAGQSNSMAQKHRHRTGPLGTFVEFWTDPDGVAQYEEYTEYIGVCKNCFAPGSSPRDAPRKHHYRRRRSNDRYGSSSRVDKESRWGSSDGENRRKSRKSWLTGGIAGYGLAEVGKTLFNQKRGTGDTYNVRFSRENASNTSIRRRSDSYSPSHGSRTSYGVTGGSSASISRRRSRSRERIETGITSDGRIYKKDPHGSVLGGPAIKLYSPRRRSRSRSRSRSGDRHNGPATAAFGAAIGSSVAASASRRRNRSPEKAFVRSKHRSRERNSGRGEVSMLGGFFSSPSEKRERSHREEKKGFFSFGNSSSSSADADLAFGSGLEVYRSRKQRSPRSRNGRSTDAAILGLSAAAAAIALRESQKGIKSSRKADLVAVKETKSKQGVPSERQHRGRRTSVSPSKEDDLWESASEEDDSLSVNSALAYGGPARRSRESLTSDSSGTAKWGWRWGSKKRSKRDVQADPIPSSFHMNTGTAAADLAGAIAGVAMTSSTWQNDSRMSSSTNLPPLQQMYPVPTSDPSRFDVMRHDSIASSNQPLMTSRPAPVPLQQPQPIASVSHTVYSTQPPYTHSYSAPNGPPVFSQDPYQPQPFTVSVPRDKPSGPTQINIPGSFPDGDIVADNTAWDGRAEFSRRRRETFPIMPTREPEVDPLPRRRQEIGLDQRREETNVQNADEQIQFEHERRSSNGVSVRRTESTSEPDGKVDRKGESQWYRRNEESKKRNPCSRVVPVATRTVGAAISASASEAAQFVAETHEEEYRKDDSKTRIKIVESPATDHPHFSSGNGTRTPDTVEQHGNITRRVISKSVKNPNHENYADYFVPPELLSRSSDDKRSMNVNGDNDITSYQIPQIIAVEPKGSGLSFVPAHAHTNEVDLDHTDLPWEVPRLKLIEPTPPHSIAGSIKGDASPIIKPEDASVEEKAEIPGSSTTSKVTWGEDETHTYQVVTPLENPEEFIGTSIKPRNEEEDIHSSVEASPIDATPILVEVVPRRMPSDFGDDLEFAATVAAGLEDTGFDPAIVIDDATFRRRDSPPGSEPTGLYRSPFAETVVDLGLGSPETEGAPPQRGFVEGELPPTPRDEQVPSATSGNADGSASKLSKNDRKSRKRVAQHESEDVVFDAFSSTSEPHDRRGVLDNPAESQLTVSVPVNVFDYLDEEASTDSKDIETKRDGDGLESLSSDSPVPADLTRRNYFDAPEAAEEVSKPSSSSQKFDDVTVDVPSAEQLVGDFQDPKSAEKRKKKSKKLEQEGQMSAFPIETTGSAALERNGEVSSKPKSDRKSSRRDSERYDLADRDSRSAMSGPASEEYREEGKSRSQRSKDTSGLYGSPSEDTPSTAASAPIKDDFDEPRKSKKKSKRGSSGYDDISKSVSSSAAFEDKREFKSKSKKSKKGGLLALFGASQSSDKLPGTAQAQDAIAEISTDVSEEPRRKIKKSKERRSTQDRDDFSSQASDLLTENVPERALPGEVDVGDTPDDFEDANGKRKKSKDPKTSGSHDGDRGYGPAYQPTSNLSRVDGDNDDGTSRRKDQKRRSRESDRMEESGRVTQALQAKVYKAASPGRFLTFMLDHLLINPEDRDLPSTRNALSIDALDVVHTRGASGEDESSSFLEERQKPRPPPDIYIPADPQNLHAEKSAEDLPLPILQPESEASQIAGTDVSPFTPPLAVFPLENLPPLPASRPESPVPEVDNHRQRPSVVLASEIPQSPVVNSSPTAIPLHFRRPPASPGPARSSPFASPATPGQGALVFVPPQRRSRPNSTEFKSSTEFRPLWLVERHGSRQEPGSVESYPSLPSSHTTSRSSSVHDPEEIDSHRYRDDGLSGSHEESDAEDTGLRIDVSHSLERPDLLGSRQATPTATSFHHDTQDNAVAEAMQDNGWAEISAGREYDVKEAARGVSPSSPQRLSYTVVDDLSERYIPSPMYIEGLEDLPPLPSSRSSSPLLEEAEKVEGLPSLPTIGSSSPLPEGPGQETLSILEEARHVKELPPLAVSRSPPPLHEDQRREIFLMSEEPGQLGELPPLPASRPSSPLHEYQRREISSMSEEAGQLEELPPLPASRSSSPLHEGQRDVISSVSEETQQLKELPPLPESKPSSPSHNDPGPETSSISDDVQQTVELSPLLMSKPSFSLDQGQRRVIAPLPEEILLPEKLPPLPASRSSHLPREHEKLDTSSSQDYVAVGAVVGLAAATVALASVKASARDGLPETEADPVSVVEETAELEKDKPQTTIATQNPDESEMLLTRKSKKEERKNRKASSSRSKDDLSVHDEEVAQPTNDQDVGSLVRDQKNDGEEEDRQDSTDAWFIPSTSKKSKKDKKGKKKGRGGEISNTTIDSLVSSNFEASSVEESRAVSPSGFLTVTDSPARPGSDIMTPSQTAEVAQGDWQGFVTGSKKSKGKKGKKKPAKSWEEEVLEPSATGHETALDNASKSLEPQGLTADYGEENPRTLPLGNADVSLPDIAGQATNQIAPALVSDAKESEPLVAISQEGEKTKEHFVLEHNPVLERSPSLQQRLDIGRQEPQSPFDRFDSVEEFSQTTNAVSTPLGDLDEEFFTPMGFSMSTKETEGEAEFPFPIGKGKASKKAKKKRKTLPLVGFVESSKTPLAPAESLATKGTSEESRAEEMGGSVGAITPTPNNTFEPAVKLARGTVSNSDGEQHLRAPPSTSQDLSATGLDPEATPLPIDDDLDLNVETEASPANPLLTPATVTLPRDSDLDLMPQTSAAAQLLAPEAVPLPSDEDFELTKAPRAAEPLLTPEVVPLPKHRDLEMSQADPAGQLLTPEAVPLPTDKDFELIETPSAAARFLDPEFVPLPRDGGLDLTEAPTASLADQELTPDAVSLPIDEKFSAIAPVAGSTNKMLSPEAIPLPADEDLSLIEASPASPADRSLTPEAVPLPEGLSLVTPRAGGSADKLSVPEAIPLPADKDSSLIEDSPTNLADQTLTPEAVSLPLDKDLDLAETPSISSANKPLNPEAPSLPIDKDSSLIEASPVTLADQTLTAEAMSLPSEMDLDLIWAPPESSAGRPLGPETVPLPIDEDSDLIEASPASLADKSLTAEAASLPIDKDLDLGNSPPASSADWSLTAEAIPLPVDEESDLIKAPSGSSEERLLTPKALPLPTDEDLNLAEALPETSAERLVAPEAISLPTDEDLDLLEVLTVGPAPQPSYDTSRESGSASGYGSRLTTEEHRGFTSLPPMPADGPNQLLSEQILGNRALEKDDVSDKVAVTKPTPELGDVDQDPSSALAQVTGDIPPVHESSPLANVAGGLDQSPVQEVADDVFAVVPKKKGKKGKRGDQSSSITPELGPASKESDFPVVITEPGSATADRAIDTETPREEIDEGDWDIPSKEKGKKGKKEKSAVREPGYSSQEAVISRDPFGFQTVALKEAKGTDIAKDLKIPPELDDNLSLQDTEDKEAPFAGESFQKKSRKGKKLKTQVKPSLPKGFTSAEGEKEEPPAISEGSLATTDTGKAVRDMLADRDSVSDPDALSQRNDIVNPLLTDPNPEQIIPEDPSNFEDHLTMDSTNKEMTIGREETEVLSTMASAPDNLLASDGKLASTSTAREVERMLADRGSPRLSRELSREDVTPLTTEGLMKPSYEDNETWDIPVKKKGKKGKKGRLLQGPESITDESSIPSTPTVEPETTQSNEDAIVGLTGSFTSKKSKKERKGKKKALRQASSSFQDEKEAEDGVEPEIDKGPGKKDTQEHSYFDQATRPAEVQELPLSPQRQSELEYATSVPLPLNEVGDEPTDVVAVERLQESEVAWSRALGIAQSEIAPVDSSHSQQLSKFSPGAQSVAYRSRELSVLGTPDPTPVETMPMTGTTRDTATEDDFMAFSTTEMGEMANQQETKQLEQERADSAEGEPLPTSTQHEVPANQEELGSSFPVDKTASGGHFSPEMGAASRDALRELELEDGVSYFGLTSVESGKDDRKQAEYHQTALAGGGDPVGLHDDYPMNETVKHMHSTASHDITLPTIVEQPDYVDPVAIEHEPRSQLADPGATNQENFSPLFESTSRGIDRDGGLIEFGTGFHSVEQNEPFTPRVDDAPIREETPQLAATAIVHPSGYSDHIGDPVSRLVSESVAEENVSLPSNEDLSTFATSRRGKKKGKKKQEPFIWEGQKAQPAAVGIGEPTVEKLEAAPTPPTFETPELGTSRNDTEYHPAEQREYRPSTEATLSTPSNFTASEGQATVDEADDMWGCSTKKTKKKGKKMKQQVGLAQSMEEQPQLEKIEERDASQDNRFRGEQHKSDEVNIPQAPHEPRESQHSDMHMLLQRADPASMAKDDEHTSVPVIESTQQAQSTSQDRLPGDVLQKSVPRADIDEVTIDRPTEHEHAAAIFAHPQGLTTTNEEKQDDLFDFPTAKKSKKFKKSKKQSQRLDMDTQPQDVQPEPSGDQLHQYTSSMSKDLPLPAGKLEFTSVSPPQLTGHHGDEQVAGAAALATIGADVAGALWHNKSEEKRDKSNNQREERQWIAHEDERVSFPSLHDTAAQPSEGSLEPDTAMQHRVPVLSQLHHASQPFSPQFSAEDEHRQNIARPPVPSFHYEDDAKRDSAVQISDSPVISDVLPTYDVVRDSGYQGTESSPPMATDPEFIDTSGAEHHPEIVEQPSTQARHEQIETPEHIRSYRDTTLYNTDNPLKISVEVDPTYEVAISRHQSRRSRGRAMTNSQDGSLDKNVAPRIDSRPASDVKSLVQFFDEPSKSSPVGSATKDRSSVLLKSPPSTRKERKDQPKEQENLHVTRHNIDRIDVSPVNDDRRGKSSEPEMSPRTVTHDGASILAARASSLAALGDLTDAHHDSPRSLFGGPVSINSDRPSAISPPRTPFSHENTGRRQLNTITEHSPEESPHYKHPRAMSDIGSPERGTKSARRSVTPQEIIQQGVRSPTVTGASDKSLMSTDDVFARLSWPPVDEDKHSVDLERSRSRNTDRRASSRHSNVSALVSDAMRQRESEHRSLSGASIRSGDSINAIIRTPEQFRSASGLSNRSGTPPLRRVDTRSVSGDLRAASKRGEANLAKPVGREAEPEPAPAPALALANPSSSTYDPVKDKGKNPVKDMADVYVSNPIIFYRDFDSLDLTVMV